MNKSDKPRKVKCEMTMFAKKKHINISVMAEVVHFVEEYLYAHNHQFSDRIELVIDWPEG